MNNSSCCNGSSRNAEERLACCNQTEAASCCEKKTMLETEAVDPVCGMKVDPNETDLQIEHERKTHYFCSTDCGDRFINDPEKYLAKDNLS
jgi:YHS domain-containing protein